MKKTFHLTDDGLQKVRQQFSLKKLTLEKLAANADLDRGTIAKILNENKPVTERTIAKLFEGLGLDFSREGIDYEEYDEKIDLNQSVNTSDTNYEYADPFYIKRYEKDSEESLEHQCYITLKQPGAIIKIKAPQGMGKKSLINEIEKKLNQETNYHFVRLNLPIFETSTLNDLEIFLKNFCAVVSNNLEIPNKVVSKWTNELSFSYNCTRYFQEYLLPQLSQPIVIIIVRFDCIFDNNITDDFCTLLRAWHENSKFNNSIWKNLRLVLSYNTESYGKFNINSSPLNVGKTIELPELSQKQIFQLVNHYIEENKLIWNPQDIDQCVSGLMELVGGSPQLLRDSLDYIAIHRINFDDFKKETLNGKGPLENHLLEHWKTLKSNYALQSAFRQIIMENSSIFLSPEHQFQLYGLGLIRQNNDGKIIPRCQLYQGYFSKQFKNSGETNNERRFGF